MSDRFALFGPSEKHDIPRGGFCISVFAVVKRDASILLLKPKENPRWRQEWAPNWRLYNEEMLRSEFERWRFPSSYIKEGESPESALKRIVSEQLGAQQYSIISCKLSSFYEPSRRYPGNMHWDYCFVFNVQLDRPPALMPWEERIEFVDPQTLSAQDFGSGQGDLAKELKLV